MAIIVQKYGGSSVADVEKLKFVAQKVVATKRAGHQVVVVVSAMGKSTDQLINLAHQIDPNPPRRELDMLLTTGERVSMALLSMAVQRLGEKAISFTGSQCGIITNDRHFDARIIEIRPHRIEDELARDNIVIIAGFQGMSYKREITTLGRGGSDTTAIALAAALGAERAEIYSDVDGVYSADPRVVKDAAHLPVVDYETMQTMADAGAKVLNATAVEFARKNKITIHARATTSDERETVVAANPSDAFSVTLQRGVVLLKGPLAALDAVTTTLHETGVEPRRITMHDQHFELYCPTALVPDWQKTLGSLQRLGLSAEPPCALVTVVATDLGSKLGALRGAASASVFWMQERSIVFVIDESRADDVTRALHAVIQHRT